MKSKIPELDPVVSAWVETKSYPNLRFIASISIATAIFFSLPELRSSAGLPQSFILGLIIGSIGATFYRKATIRMIRDDFHDLGYYAPDEGPSKIDPLTRGPRSIAIGNYRPLPPEYRLYYSTS